MLVTDKLLIVFMLDEARFHDLERRDVMEI